MNKIEIARGNKISNDLGDKIELSNESGKIKIIIKDNNDAVFELINNEKIDITIIVGKYCNVHLLEVKSNDDFGDCNYHYVLEDESNLMVDKFYNIKDYNEKVNVTLKGVNSNIVLNMASICSGKQNYDITIDHKNKNTTSNISNHGVTFNCGVIDMTVNGIINKGMSNCTMIQNNKIILMGNAKSIIRPNLFIDEDIVQARHGASIGRFNEDEIFYLKTRGISEEDSYNLLIKGFLLGFLHVDDDIRPRLESIIDNFGGE